MRALIAFLPHDLRRQRPARRPSAFAFSPSRSSPASPPACLSGLAPALHAGRDSLVSSLRERGGTGFGGVRLRKMHRHSAGGLLPHPRHRRRALPAHAHRSAGQRARLRYLRPPLLRHRPVQNGYSRADASRLVRRLDEQVRALPATRFLRRCPICLPHRRRLEQRRDHPDRSPHRDRSQRQLQRRQPRFLLHPRRSPPRRPRFRRSATPARPARSVARSAIVNEAFVKRYLAGRDPLGVRIGGAPVPTSSPIDVIVGVVADFNYRGLRDDSEQVFFPLFEGDDSRRDLLHQGSRRSRAGHSVHPPASSARPTRGCRSSGSARWTTRSTARSTPSACWRPLSGSVRRPRARCCR